MSTSYIIVDIANRGIERIILIIAHANRDGHLVTAKYNRDKVVPWVSGSSAM
jgi:hypothetical protein